MILMQHKNVDYNTYEMLGAKPLIYLPCRVLLIQSIN